MQPHLLDAETLRQHYAKKERAARFARSAYTLKPKPLVVARPTVVYAQADAHCRVWENKKIFDAVIPRRVTSVTRVQSEVAKHFGLTISDLLNRRRIVKHSYPRQIAYWLCRKINPARSYPELGRKFNGRDHTSVLHGVQKISALVKSDPAIKSLVAELEQRVRA